MYVDFTASEKRVERGGGGTRVKGFPLRVEQDGPEQGTCLPVACEHETLHKLRDLQCAMLTIDGDQSIALT